MAACWLTIAATPEGAQGQVTFQVVFFLPPQEARSGRQNCGEAGVKSRPTCWQNWAGYILDRTLRYAETNKTKG